MSASINDDAVPAGDFSSIETCRGVAPGEMVRGIARGIDDCRDTWADWAVFERGEPEPQEWPTGSLAPIARGRECVYHKPQTLKMAAGTPVGHGIHSVLA